MDRDSRLGSLRLTLSLAGQALRAWTRRQVLIAVAGAAGFFLLVGFATVLIPNPVFAREIAPVGWNYPVWFLVSVLSGILLATYARPGRAEGSGARASRFGVAGGVLAWFAVGCPVCNKIALLALGYSGAMTWFAPVQPLLALVAISLSAVALAWRLRGQVACPAPARGTGEAAANQTAGAAR